jgi:hypothetical protein
LRSIPSPASTKRRSAGRTPCAISREALDDHFDGDNKDKLKVFNASRERIEHEARRKYLADLVESDGSVLIKTMDL